MDYIGLQEKVRRPPTVSSPQRVSLLGSAAKPPNRFQTLRVCQHGRLIGIFRSPGITGRGTPGQTRNFGIASPPLDRPEQAPLAIWEKI